MAFDGVTVAAVVQELNTALTGGRIYKIAQPEADELLLTVKNNREQYRLVLSASASLPLVYLTEDNKPSPLSAPNFCMLLRKHIQNGRILKVSQPGLERVIVLHIEHLNDLGDICTKQLLIELMGKHSNIIFCDENNRIIDSIKHISGMVSSVREVLPGRTYFIPMTQDKQDPLTADRETFGCLFQKGQPLYKALYTSYTGFSPTLAQELCYLSGLDADLAATALTLLQQEALWQSFSAFIMRVRQADFTPCIVSKAGVPIEFAALPLTRYPAADTNYFTSISQVLKQYYAQKDAVTRIRQKSADLRRVVQTALERNSKKYDLQLRQMQDTQKRDKYRIYGELLNTYGYTVPAGARSTQALNYYTNETITIPLDETLSASENAKKYFEKYNKMKRTYEALSALTLEVKAEIEHLQSILSALDIALLEEDLVEIKEELIENGYLKRKGGSKNKRREKITSRPFHYISSDGFDMYVGKNNYQNDELTFHFASGNDWWFHAKGMPGSHVIVQSRGEELPDTTFEEAGRLAAHYSQGRGQEKVEIDYVEKKHVKKPNGSKPGFVVYYTNYSLMIDSDISKIKEVST